MNIYVQFLLESVKGSEYTTNSWLQTTPKQFRKKNEQNMQLYNFTTYVAIRDRDTISLPWNRRIISFYGLL